MTEQEITIVCPDCGSKDFECPADPQPEDVITCTGCGWQEAYRVIETMALEQVEAMLKKGSGDLFG